MVALDVLMLVIGAESLRCTVERRHNAIRRWIPCCVMRFVTQ